MGPIFRGFRFFYSNFSMNPPPYASAKIKISLNNQNFSTHVIQQTEEPAVYVIHDLQDSVPSILATSTKFESAL